MKKILAAGLLFIASLVQANDYYTHGTFPVAGAAATSAAMRAELDSITAGFNLLPTITANGSKIIAVNSGATALEAITTTGTGSGVRATSPTFTTPILGVAAATSINKVTLTTPATGSTLTIADGKTLTASNTLTLTATDGSTLAIGTGGTLGTAAYTAATDYATAAQVHYVGTTSIAANRASASQALTGITSIDGSAATATTATNLAAGSGGTIPYQSAAATTAMLANGTVGQWLKANGTTVAPSWADQSTFVAGSASAVAVGGITGLGTGVATALAVNVGTAGSPVLNGGALGSPSSAGTIPAFTLGGTVAGGGNQINNVIIGTSTPLAGAFTTIAGTTKVTLSAAGSDTVAAGAYYALGGAGAEQGIIQRPAAGLGMDFWAYSGAAWVNEGQLRSTGLTLAHALTVGTNTHLSSAGSDTVANGSYIAFGAAGSEQGVIQRPAAGLGMDLWAFDGVSTFVKTLAVRSTGVTVTGTIQGASTISVGGATPSASGAGITFPATQSASTDANTLDDYEEGTFTPTLAFGGSTTGITYAEQLGTYTKIGRLVKFGVRITLTNNGSGTGGMTMAGYPFASIAGIGNPLSYYFESGVTFDSGSVPMPYKGAGNTTGGADMVSAAGSRSNMTDTNFTNTATFELSGTYHTS